MAPARIKSIGIGEVEYIAYELAHEMLRWNEPIPDFETRFPNRLESCLAVPFFSFQRRIFYRGLVGKAAVLFYVMIKNHPFQNGNKRIAMTTLLVFLARNGRWLRVDEQKLYNFAKMVAESDPVIKDEIIKAIEKFISVHLVKAS